VKPDTSISGRYVECIRRGTDVIPAKINSADNVFILWLKKRDEVIHAFANSVLQTRVIGLLLYVDRS
jgi:hypothetical protein